MLCEVLSFRGHVLALTSFNELPFPSRFFANPPPEKDVEDEEKVERDATMRERATPDIVAEMKAIRYGNPLCVERKCYAEEVQAIKGPRGTA